MTPDSDPIESYWTDIRMPPKAKPAPKAGVANIDVSRAVKEQSSRLGTYRPTEVQITVDGQVYRGHVVSMRSEQSAPSYVYGMGRDRPIGVTRAAEVEVHFDVVARPWV